MQFDVRDDRLHLEGRPVPFVPSPNTSGARIEPALIVLHDTAGSSADGAVSWFKNPGSKVSAHLVVDLDGRVTQCVELDRVAWHTGKSSHKGRANCNGFAIGIEIVNPGGLKGDSDKAVAEFGKVYAGAVAASDPGHWSKLWLPYTEAQLAAVEGIIPALARAYPTITDLAGHYEISPGRKEDPTPLLDWARMRRAMGTPALSAEFHPAHLVKDMQGALAELGYNPGKVDGLMGARTRGALRTFQEQNKLPITGSFDAVTEHALFDKPDAKEMPTGTRSETTAADLRAQGSVTTWATLALKGAAMGVAGVHLGSSLIDAGKTVSDLSSAVDTIETGISTVKRVDALLPDLVTLLHWAVTPRGLISLGILAGIGALWGVAHLIESRRVADAQSGANAK